MSKLSLVSVPSMGTNFNGEETTVKVNVDAFALQALSGKNLYRNLIRAIVRELSCNAVDSHVLAGKGDVPFSVHLPTIMEPFFSVRDYGIGLDDAGVREVYLTYFGSTKRSCEKTIGAWGLGSKSPLGYTENFTINAIKDGIKRMYVVFKNSEGMPAVKMMAQNETDECNGVEVVLPVIDENDMNKFRDEAKTIFTWFPVKPNFNFNFEVAEPNWVHRYATPRVSIKAGGNSVIIHGNIAYPIDIDQVENIDGLRNKTVLHHCGLVLHADLGTVDYSMSREELSYNDKTLKTINDIMIELRDALPTLAGTMMDGLSRWDAYHTALKLVKNQLFVGVKDKIEALSPLHVDMGADDQYCWFKYNHIKFYKKARCKNYKSNTRHSIHIVPEDETVFWINDTGKKTGIKALVSYNQNLGSEVIVFDSEDIKADLLNRFGGEMKFRNLSELPVPPKVQREKADKVDCTARIFDSSDGKFNFNPLPIETVLDNPEPLYYIKLKGYRAAECDGYVESLMQFVGCKTLYGVNAKGHALLEDTDHIDLIDAAKQKFLEELTNFKVGDYKINVDESFKRVVKVFTGIEDIGIIEAALNGNGKSFELFWRVAKCFNVSVSGQNDDLIAKQREVGNRISELKSKYPLVFTVTERSHYGVDNDTINELRLYVSAKASVGG